jgi:MFS family permease
MPDFRIIFRSMKYKNYRLFFFGQAISLTGTWMQIIALAWLVYRLTDSALLLGVVGFSSQIPAFLLAPFAGVAADRYNRRRILIATQVLAMIQAFILAGLVISGNIAVWHIIILSVFIGMIGSFEIPLRHAFVVEMIGKRQDLNNAIALNASLFNAARLIGPSAAGVLIALFGEGICFLLNAISYIAVLITLIAIKVPQRHNPVSRKHVFQELKDGFIYAFNSMPIKATLFMLALISLMGVPYQVLMPIFARDIFHAGPVALGYLMGVSGLGALAGVIYLAARKSSAGLGRIIALSSVVFGAGIMAFGLSKTMLLSLPVIFIIGFAMMVQMAAGNIVLQTAVEEDKRGRIMSLYTMAFMGTMPLGSLMAGVLAERIGAPNTLLLGGMCCIIGGAVFAGKLKILRKQAQQVYAGKNIMPEAAKGIEAASGLKGV